MSLSKYFKTTRSNLCIVLAMLALSACSESVSTVDVAADGSSALTMAPPSFLNTRAVVVENLELVVTINRERVEMIRSGDVWTGQTSVQIGSDVALEVQWSELFGSRNLPLALARETVSDVNNSFLFEVIDSSYVIDGSDFDADSDSINNITERRQDTDPYDANSPGTVDDVPADANLPATTISNAIDGLYNTAYWNNATFTAPGGEDLLINSLIVDVAGNAIDGNTDYQWGGAHDEEYLTLFVFGKRINSAAGVEASRDSGELAFNDDVLEIFLDGDLSSGNGYDTVDDLQILIPLLRGSGGTLMANKSDEFNSEIYLGGNVSDAVKLAFDETDVAIVEYAVCLCEGFRTTWEIRINMAAANIPLGKTFGFDLQINQDDDGGARDTKWSWAADSLLEVGEDVNPDRTWRSPRYMGAMKLLPF